jgi:hypothetical protein
MAKYGAAAKKKVATVMHERKAGTLRSGSGKKVTSRKQAIAIALSEARDVGAKVPRPKTAAKKKTGAKKSAARKTGAKKTGATRTSKSTAKKTTRKKSAAKKR